MTMIANPAIATQFSTHAKTLLLEITASMVQRMMMKQE
jgi:hypothetical protein